MRLKDLVHRSALRTRLAGDSEVGLPTGMDYQVVEVTGVTVPAGADWSIDTGTPHLIDTIDIAHSYDILGLSTYLEIDAEVGDSATLQVSWTEGDIGVQLVSISGSGAVEVNTEFDIGPLIGFTAPSIINSSFPVPLAVRLLTGAEAAAPITVNRARVVFLIF